MHAVVMESLEEYLSGVLEPAVSRPIEAHLHDCPRCRAEVESFAEAASLLGALRSEGCEPAPGFYQRFTERREARRAPSLTGLFGFDLILARRLALSGVLTLAVLASVLISREVTYRAGFTPEAVLSQESAAGSDIAPAQDNMLLTLTAYER